MKMAEQGKVCSRCGEWKLLSGFHKRSANAGGLACWCKACTREYRLGYQEINRERINTQQAGYRKANKEEIAARNKAYYEANKVELAAKHKIWGKAYRMANKEKVAARLKAWREANPDKVLEWVARRRALKAGAAGSHTRAEFRTLCELFGWVCLCCGKPHEESPLTEDHVVPLSNGGSDDITNIQPLCLSCNDSKWTKMVDYRGGDKWVKDGDVERMASRSLGGGC